jgi:hypothetical protein
MLIYIQVVTIYHLSNLAHTLDFIGRINLFPL